MAGRKDHVRRFLSDFRHRQNIIISSHRQRKTGHDEPACHGDHQRSDAASPLARARSRSRL